VIPRLYTLSPSSFAFLWDECKSCFWWHVAQNLRRPSAPFPSIFSAIDVAMKKELENGWHEFGSGQLKFRIAHTSQMVTSAPVSIPGRSVRLLIRGSFDSIVQFEDHAHAVCDFKTAAVKDEYNGKYARQLHAYAYALEHPATNSLVLPGVRRLGLAVFEPTAFSLEPQLRASLIGNTSWIEVPYDEATFMAFLDEVAALLEQPTAPPPNVGCEFCRFKVLNALKSAA
jgi:PD-(D/E)XK nuclease superfamily